MTDAQRDRAAELDKAIKLAKDELAYCAHLQVNGGMDVHTRLFKLAERLMSNLSALAEAAPGEAMGELRMDGSERVVTWRPSAYELPLGTKFYASPPLAPEPIEKSIYARACENDPLVKQAEQVVGALAPERAEDRRDALAFVFEVADLHGYKFGEYHASSSAETVHYSCMGCDAEYVSHWPEWKVEFIHKPNCRYVAAIAAMQAGGTDK